MRIAAWKQPMVSVLAAMLAATATDARARDGVTVTVRVYDTAGVGIASHLATLDLAAGIVSETSISLSWRTCGKTDSCADALGQGELILRLASSPVPGDVKSNPQLGSAVIDKEKRLGVLATVYCDRVAWRASRAKVDEHLLLSRVIAHELGHLLLGTTSHTRDGLMRADWTRDELMRVDPSAWSFSPGEVSAIRTRIDLIANPHLGPRKQNDRGL
jgi:hypothetical protein